MDAEKLSQCLLSALSKDSEVRQGAEKLIFDAAHLPEYGRILLQVVAESRDDLIRLAASVTFKNYLRSRWLPDGDSGVSPIADSEKEQIKKLIVSLMESSSLSPRIKIQLNEALIVIGIKDYLTFLPRIVSQLHLHLAAMAPDYASVNSILWTADSIFREFRQENLTPDQLIDLKYCHDTFYHVLLSTFHKTDLLFGTTAASSPTEMDVLVSLIESLRLCCSIFFSFNFLFFPHVFKIHLKELMTNFLKYLSHCSPLGFTDDLCYVMVININLYMLKYEKDHFAEYVNGFARDIFKLLIHMSTYDISDELATSAIKFLTSVSTSGYHVLLSDHEVIKQICLHIAIPNSFLRVEEEELFEMNYMEFIRRDIEPSGVENRRNSASELLKGLMRNYKTEVRGVVMDKLRKLHSEFSENPTDLWRYQACVIDLVISLDDDMLRLVFQKIILSELHGFNISSPMLKARSLKFLATFCGHILKPNGIELFRDLARLLQAESNVVHSYAARCIEKLLLVKEEGGESRYVAGDIPAGLMRNLFDALALVGSEQNHYIMKSIMLVFGVAEISQDAARSYITEFTSILREVCNNRKNPVFNDYVFESIAVLLRRTHEGTIPYTFAIEMFLFPCVMMIYEIADFRPSAVQIVYLLLKLNSQTLTHWIRLWGKVEDNI